ncbi:MAG: signal peptide peptidase SppA [Proteobacteria bacterium]|nr:signal peptide peptidase SppA [Pseudomonadota bacterium]
MTRPPARRRYLVVAVVGFTLCWGSTGCITLNVFDGGPSALTETVVFGEKGPKILMLEIDGVITESPDRGSWLSAGQESTVARVREQLDAARKERSLVAVLLRIDSPGGGATASELVYREILNFKKEKGVPVVAQLMGTATSGGYYVAMAADEVVAHPTTVTGSIGVIFLGINLSGLMEKLGIEDQTITAGRYKDTGSPLRPMKPDEREQLQGIIDDLHARFREVVVTGRPELDAASVETLADGRIYSARQAVANGLVDRIATLEETVEALEERTGNEHTRVISYHRRREWRRNLYTKVQQPGAPVISPVIRLDLGPLLGPFAYQGPGFHYLWWPGAQ